MKFSATYRLRHAGVLSAFFAAFCGLSSGCEESELCQVDADCETFCRSYSGNSIYFACKDNACLCPAVEELKCTGKEGETICAEFCAKYAPDKSHVCNDGSCHCE